MSSTKLNVPLLLNSSILNLDVVVYVPTRLGFEPVNKDENVSTHKEGLYIFSNRKHKP